MGRSCIQLIYSDINFFAATWPSSIQELFCSVNGLLKHHEVWDLIERSKKIICKISIVLKLMCDIF